MTVNATGGHMFYNPSGLGKIRPPPEDTSPHFHLHDLDMFAGYCAGWSLRALLDEGFNGVENRVECGPPRHLRTALGRW